MGIFRTLLAISVVFAHSIGFVIVGGQLAVQLFYIISGFLISFVVVEAKSYSSIKSFYQNRLLRLFPIYWTVAFGSLLIFAALENDLRNLVGDKPQIYSLTGGAATKSIPLFTVYSEINWFGKISLVLSNIFLFGQDWTWFTGVEDGSFQFVSDFSKSEIFVFHGLIVPPAWTLGVELSFYLIAPFVLPRKRLLFSLLAASLVLRIILVLDGIGFRDPWTYKFFPAELALFLLGALSHQLWMPYLMKRGWLSKHTVKTVTLLVIVYCTIFFLLPMKKLNALILILVVLISLPFLFEFQKRNKFDRKIGDLSYPIYISHYIVIITVEYISIKSYSISYRDHESQLVTFGAVSVIMIMTILVSFLLNHFIGNKVEKIRNLIKTKQKSP